MLIRKTNFMFYCGPDFERDIRNSIMLYWNKVGSPKEGECMFHNYVKISWHWLPDIHFFYNMPWPEYIVDCRINSKAWTGRTPKRFYFRWPFKVGCKLYNG